jgi:hypothetical protein
MADGARPCLFVQLNSEAVPVELSREPAALNMGCEAPVGTHNADATGPVLCLRSNAVGLFFQSLTVLL